MESEIATKLDEFFTQFKKQTYKKGEMLVRADDNPSGIFYLTKGSVKQYAISKKGDELVVNMFKPISFFPMSWAMNDTPNHYYFETITEAEVWKAPVEKVLEFLRMNSDVLYDLLKRVYRGTDGLFMRMTYLMSGNANSRLITELLIHAKRFGKKNSTQGSITLEMTESDLATSAGMTRETVSREMKVLKSKNLVSLENNAIIIHSISNLEEELSGDY